MDKQIGATQAGFENIKYLENDIEFWLARDLMPMLEYTSGKTL